MTHEYSCCSSARARRLVKRIIMASANDEEASLNHEERRLSLETQKVSLDERRLLLDQRRLSFEAAQVSVDSVVVARDARPPQQEPVVVFRPPPPANDKPLAPPANNAPKILTKAELKEAAKATTLTKAPAALSNFLRLLVPQHDMDAHCNDANALRAREVVHAMEHDSMRKRKAETLQDKGVQGKGVINGKAKKVVGIPSTYETAMRNLHKFIPPAEQHEYVYDAKAKKLFCKLCGVLISRVEYLDPDNHTCHHATKQHQDNRRMNLQTKVYHQNLSVAIRDKQNKMVLTTQITDANFAFRTDVVKFSMQAGIHLEVFANRNSPMRQLFDKYVSVPSNNQLKLTDASHLRKTHIPLVHDCELALINQELSESDGWISVEFDETTKHRLWWAAVFRFVLKGVTQQRLVRLAAYTHGPDELIGRQLSSMVIDTLEFFHIPRIHVQAGSGINDSTLY